MEKDLFSADVRPEDDILSWKLVWTFVLVS